jgi:hypothetical protein
MQKTLMGETTEWSVEQPSRQSDALRRLFTTGDITPADLADLVCPESR